MSLIKHEKFILLRRLLRENPDATLQDLCDRICGAQPIASTGHRSATAESAVSRGAQNSQVNDISVRRQMRRT
jgi:hypothetical protein